MSIAEILATKILWVAGALIASFFLIASLVGERIRKQYNRHDIAEVIGIFLLSTVVFLLAIALIRWIYPCPDACPDGANAGNFSGLGFLIAGMVAVPTTAVIALWRYRITDKQATLDRERNRSEALTKASELLGDSKVAAQQGGLFALGRLARSSKEDHPIIMKIVAGFIRHRAPVPTSPPTDSVPVRAVEVEAAATVIRDRNPDHDTKLDALVKRKKDGTLEEKEWRFDLSGIQLNNIDFTRVDMSVANMSDSVFKGCIFERANFSEANLTKADLSDSDLGDAILKNADLTGADLSSVQGLTQAQVNDALGNKKGGGTEEATKLPDNIQFPEKWPECS